MMSKTSQAYQDIKAASKELTQGIVLCVDPSIGSDSSMPGWALYSSNVSPITLNSGTIRINPSASTPERLQVLNYNIRKLIQKYNPDVLVYENITDVPYTGFSGRSLAPLQKALGAILSISGPDKYVGIFASSWKKLARPEYTKSDENDAIELGWVAIQQAHLILSSETEKEKSKKKKEKKK